MRVPSKRLNSHSFACLQSVHFAFHVRLCPPKFFFSARLMQSITHESLGFWIACCEFQISCQWNLKAGFQSLTGFRFLCAELRIPKPRVPDSTCKNFLENGIRITIILRVIQPYSQYIRSSWEIIIN